MQKSTTELGSPCRLRLPGSQRMPPVDAFEHVTELRRGNDDNAIGGRGPNELAALQPLSVERHAERVVPENFYQIAATPTENEQVAGVRIALQSLLNLQGKRV